MGKNFKDQIDNYFRSFRLTEAQVCRLERLQAGGCARRPARHALGVSLLRVAMVVLIAAGGWLGWQHFWQGRHVNRLVAEIVYNHNKQMTMEIDSKAMDEIKAYLDKLDFNLIAPLRLSSDQWQLLGGRYCSLQGRLAAQLKLRRTSSGKVYTLFQMVCPSGLPQKADLRQSYVQGAEVQLWTERGLLLGMAGDQ